MTAKEELEFLNWWWICKISKRNKTQTPYIFFIYEVYLVYMTENIEFWSTCFTELIGGWSKQHRIEKIQANYQRNITDTRQRSYSFQTGFHTCIDFWLFPYLPAAAVVWAAVVVGAAVVVVAAVVVLKSFEIKLLRSCSNCGDGIVSLVVAAFKGNRNICCQRHIGGIFYSNWCTCVDQDWGGTHLIRDRIRTRIRAGKPFVPPVHLQEIHKLHVGYYLLSTLLQ